jgi:hypothetical protein
MHYSRGKLLAAAALAFSVSSIGAWGIPASASPTVAGPDTVTLQSGEAVPINPDVRTDAQEAKYRDQINQLVAQDALTPDAMAQMGLQELPPSATEGSAVPVDDESASGDESAVGDSGASGNDSSAGVSSSVPADPDNVKALSCKVGDAATSASAITVSRPTIVFNGSSSGYVLYATAKYKWATDKPYSACTGPLAVGGVDGFAIALNRTSINRGLSFTGCNAFGKCASNGYLETNSSYGGGWAVHDYAGNVYNGDGPTHTGTLTYAFRLSSLSGCTQAFSKYGHDWNSTAVNGFGIGPWSISVQWTSSSSNWTKSSQAGSYGSC